MVDMKLCETSGGGTNHSEYQPYGHNMDNEQSNYMGSQGNQRPQHPPGYQQPPYQQEKKPNLEEMLLKFISVSETHFQNSETALKNQQASIQSLETQIGQLPKLISERPQGSLPSNTEPNLREQLNTINIQDDKGVIEPEPEQRQETMVSKGQGEVDQNTNKPVTVEYKPHVPYPNATRKDRSDEQFDKFLKLLKKLHINLSFIEALSQMPNAMKFLNELLANKRKLDEASHVELNAVNSHSGWETKQSPFKLAILATHQELKELDEWRTHKPRTPDKPKLRQTEPDTSPNQLKVGDKVLLDVANPHIVTTTPNEEIPLTVLSIFPFGTMEVSHPKFGTFKVFDVVFVKKENRRTCLKEEEGSVLFRRSNRENLSPSPTVQLADSIRALLTTDPWELFFGIIEPTYLELTMELCSTFHLQTVMTYYDDPGTVQFRLGGLIRQLSVPEFGAALGLYTEDFKEENELHDLSRHIHFSPSKCWHTLAPSTASYNPSRSKGGERALASSTPTTSTSYGACHKGTSLTLPISSPLRFSTERSGMEGGRLYWPLHDSTAATLRAPQHRGPRIILHPHRPNYRLTQSTEEEAYEDIPDDVPPQHEDPPTQPPPPSRPVHAEASYADISERLTRFEQQCFQRFKNIDATLQQICQHLQISSPVPPREPSSDEDVKFE
ncbi:hypothetical protein GOBAR_AA24245 [Gossypium barbadense]|uniref:Retrotransposon gag domain-containing protein n=1 Tax=Gossypium barbadense TaxID=3634 RepID=A0A2P5WZA7_GOSBA|nr:hypothetical protein GOBAR_AA24245 [Gossypium barbadense]